MSMIHLFFRTNRPWLRDAQDGTCPAAWRSAPTGASRIDHRGAAYDEPASNTDATVAVASINELREQILYADAGPAAPATLNEGADGDRTLDELF